MERHNSCVNTRAIITYIDHHFGRAQDLLAGLEKDLAGLGDPLLFLKDPNNWVSSRVCLKLYENARLISGDEEVAFKIGFESVTHKKLGYIQQILLRAWASPQRAMQRLKAINDQFNRNKEVETVRLHREGAVVRLHWHPHLDLSRDFCLMNQGVYSAIPTLWGLPPTRLVETKCAFQGGDCCEFDLHWKNPSVWHRLGVLRRTQRGLLADTLDEMERDKRLLQVKHSEVLALNLSLQGKIDQLMSIQQASGAILAELDCQRLYPTVLQLFVKAIGYSRGMIMLVDERAGVLRFEEGVGARAQELKTLQGYSIPLDRGQNLLVRVAQSGQPLICEDATLLNLNPDNLIIREYRPKSIVILPLTAQGRVMGLLAADRMAEEPAVPRLDRDYLQVFANQVALAIENARMYRDLRDSYLSTVQSLALALEAKDTYTRGHSERVTEYAARLAQKLDLHGDILEQIRRVSILHDIGKIGVDRAILNKCGQLLKEEWEVIRQHPQRGQTIIAPLRLTYEEVAIVRNHHERYDGQGYPDGLKGEQLPIQVRVVTVADSFDAMTSDRPYRPALDVRHALRELAAGAGRQFDPMVVEAFSEMVRRGDFRDLLVRPTAGEPPSRLLTVA